MINGFYKETHPLTTEELALVTLFVETLSLHVGEERAVTSSEIVVTLKSYGVSIQPPRIRKLIHHIRVNKLIKNLVATSNGYYIETDPKKISDYSESLKMRAAAILAVADSFT